MAEWPSARVAEREMINAQGVFEFMDRACHYRRQADHARQLAEVTLQPNLEETLRHLAQDFDEIAADIDSGATEVCHPELLPYCAARLGAGGIRNQAKTRSANYRDVVSEAPPFIPPRPFPLLQGRERLPQLGGHYLVADDVDAHGWVLLIHPSAAADGDPH